MNIMKPLCLILLLAVSATPACSRFSASRRQDRAYAAHLKKSRVDRDRRLAQYRHDVARRPASPAPIPSEPREMISESPQPVPRDSENQ
jgi:hypothetical protein